MDPFTQNPVPTMAALLILSFLIVCLNVLAIVVLLKGNRRKLPVEYPLLSLLVANGIEGLVSVPAYAFKKWKDDNSYYVCDIFRFSYFISGHVALFSLLATSTERIIALAFPFKYRNIVSKTKAIISVGVLWAFVVILDLIPFFPGSTDDQDICNYKPQSEWTVAMILLTTVIPFPILCSNYIYIIKVAYYHAEKLSADIKAKKFNRSWSSRTVKNLQLLAQLRATKRIIVIIGAYIICWGPSCIYYMLAALCSVSCFKAEQKNVEKKQWIRFFLKLLVFIHALIAPVVFCWRSKIFRSQAKEVLRLNDFKMSYTNGSLYTRNESQLPAKSQTIADSLE